MTDVRSPNVIKDLPMRSQCGGRQISTGESGFIVTKKRIEHVAAGLSAQGNASLVQMPIMREFLSEAEGAGGNLRFDAGKVDPGTMKIRLIGHPSERRPEPHAINREGQLDAVRTCGFYTACYRFAAHFDIDCTLILVRRVIHAAPQTTVTEKDGEIDGCRSSDSPGWSKHPNRRRAPQASAHCDVKSIRFGHEEPSSSTPGGREACNSEKLILLLRKYVDEPFTANDVKAASLGVIEDVVGIAARLDRTQQAPIV